MDNNKSDNYSNAQSQGVSARDIFSFLWNLKWWILSSAAVALLAAFLYIHTSTPMYQRYTQVMLANERTGNTEIQLVTELSGMRQTSLIDNEIFIFRSPSLMTKVVEELNLNVRYFCKKPFGPEELFPKKREFYKDNPIAASFIFDPLYPEHNKPGSISIELTPIDGTSFTLNNASISKGGIVKEFTDKTKTFHFGNAIVFEGVRVIITTVNPSELKPGDKYYCTWTQPYTLGTALSKRLSVTVEEGVVGKMSKTDVITMSLQDTKPSRADDVLVTLTLKYNEESREYKSTAAKASIEFIDRRLKTISTELGRVESNYRSYQSSQTLVNIETQSNLTLTSDMQYESQLTDIRLQQSILEMISDDLRKMKEGEYKVIPSNIGVSDASLNQVINNYNALVAERNRLVANSSENNPRVKNIDLQLRDGRNSITLSIENLNKVYFIREREINEALNRSKAKMSKIPTQQFDLTQIERKQQIIEPLYLHLQQKKEEAQMTMYTTTDNARVIESSFGSGAPISPNKSKILLIALLLGCVIPPLFFYLLNVLRSKVLSKEDIEKVLSNPVIAVIPKCNDTGLIKSSNGRDSKAESFRMLRSAIDYSSGKVVHITSSNSGEGKSFVAANLAVSMAHTGRKVALLELDLRKPAISGIIDGKDVKRENTIVSYLVGKTDNPKDCVVPCSSTHNLDIAFAGPVPPNPSELLSTDRLVKLIDYFRQQYDFVICDSSPLMLVADSFLVNKLVDLTIYVVRSGFTPLKMLPEIQNVFTQRNIKSPCIVLNSMNIQSKSFRYGYGYGQDYGYGYGYGYGYARDNESPKRERESTKK